MEKDKKTRKKPRFSLLVRIGSVLILTVSLTSAFALLNSRFYFGRMAAIETQSAFLAGAAGAIELIDTDLIEEQLKDEAFRNEIKESYREICLKSDMEYLLLYTVDSKLNKHYLVSAGSTDKLDEVINARRGYGEVVDSPLRRDQIRCLNGNSKAEMSFLSQEYDCVWTAKYGGLFRPYTVWIILLR